VFYMHISDIIWTNEDINVRIWSDEELHMFYEHVSVHVWTNDDFYAYFVCISELPWPIEDL
jgi:hypothetical protein